MQEPYRVIIKSLRAQLNATLTYLEGSLKGERTLCPHDLLEYNEQLWEPLHAC